jgi:hypothetical protein
MPSGRTTDGLLQLSSRLSRAPAAPARAGLGPHSAQTAATWRAGPGAASRRTGRGGQALRGHRCGSSAASFGRQPAGRGGCRQARQARTRPQPGTAVTPWWPRLQKLTARPPRAGHPVTEQRSQSRGAPSGRVACDGASRHPLSSDLPRRTSASIEADGVESRLPPSLVVTAHKPNDQRRDLSRTDDQVTNSVSPALPWLLRGGARSVTIGRGSARNTRSASKLS